MIQNILITCLALFMLSTVRAQQPAYAEEIPYEEVKGKIIIPAVVDGVKGRYIFDTGAPMCLTYSRAKHQQQPSSVMKALDANGRESEFQTMNLGEIRLGVLSFADVNAVVFEEGNLLECYGVDGIVGSNLFASSVIRIDSRRRVLTISSNATSYRIPARNSYAMTVNGQNTPYIQVSPGMGIQEKMMFDSGSDSFIDLNAVLANALRTEGCLKVLSTGFGALSWGAGGMEKADEKLRVEMADLRIGVGKFRNVSTVTMNGSTSRIGSGLLKYGIVTIDYPAAKFSFEPFKPEPVDMAKKYWNVDLTLQGDQIVAGCVWGEMRQQLKGGERVVEINGQRTGKYDPCQVLTSDILKLDGEEMTVVVMDSAGQEHKMVIRKE